MRRRILLTILSVVGVAIFLFGVPLAIVVGKLVDDGATLRVERQAVLASRNVPADFATSGDPVELPDGIDGVVLGLYGRDGGLFAGAGPPTADASTVQAMSNAVVDREVGESRIVAVPVAADEVVVGVIRAEQPTAASDSRVAKVVCLLLGLGMVVLGVGGALGFVLAGRLVRPVRRLRDAAVQLGTGDFTVEVPRSNIVEIDEAAVAMTATARRLDDLVARERSFSADASHQLRTPLAGLRASIETELQFPRPDRAEVLNEAIVDIDRLERTISELLTHARTPQVVSAPVAVDDVLSEVEAIWSRRFARNERSLVIAPARYSPPAAGSAALLKQALDVLLDNSLKHGAGEVRVSHTATAHSVTISISDEGPGFNNAAASETTATDPAPAGQSADSPEGSPAGRAAMSETANEASVHGLGLPLARRLIEAMPGRLTFVHTGPHPQIDIVLQRPAV